MVRVEAVRLHKKLAGLNQIINIKDNDKSSKKTQSFKIVLQRKICQKNIARV
jgi:hypothetical protein